MISVKIQGIDQLRAALKRLPLAMQRRMVTAASRESLNVLRDEARIRAPHKTYALRRAISSAAYKGRRSQDVEGRVYVKGRLLSKKRGVEDVFYARFMEFGFTARDGSRVPGFGFMRGAFEVKARAAIDKFSDASRRRLTDSVNAAK